MKKKRLTFFGDSICVGQGVSIHKGWVTRIAAKLSEYSDKKYDDLIITNSSINGNTTRLALERMPYDIQSHGVDIMILQFGMNDCNYWKSDMGLPRVSLASFKTNMIEIIERAFTFGAKKILVNTNHPTTLDEDIYPNTNITYQQSNKCYNEAIRNLVSEVREDVILNDIEHKFQEELNNEDKLLDEYLLEDGLHLSIKGHDLYYKSIFPVLESTLENIFTKNQYEKKLPK